MMWSPLFHHLLGRQWVETQISIARRRDADTPKGYEPFRVPPLEPTSGEGRRPEFTR